MHGHGRSSLFIYTDMSVPRVIGTERHGSCKVLVHVHERSSLYIYKNMSVPHVLGNERPGILAMHGQRRSPLLFIKTRETRERSWDPG